MHVPWQVTHVSHCVLGQVFPWHVPQFVWQVLKYWEGIHTGIGARVGTSVNTGIGTGVGTSVRTGGTGIGTRIRTGIGASATMGVAGITVGNRACATLRSRTRIIAHVPSQVRQAEPSGQVLVLIRGAGAAVPAAPSRTSRSNSSAAAVVASLVCDEVSVLVTCASCLTNTRVPPKPPNGDWSAESCSV